jgi:hypothetical protein
MWVVLIVGGVVTVSFIYLLGVSTGWMHLTMIVAYTFVLVLILYTIRSLDYPSDDLVQVTPAAFEAALAGMEAAGR